MEYTADRNNLEFFRMVFDLFHIRHAYDKILHKICI